MANPPEKLYGEDLTYRDWRRAARECAKEKFFRTHQWTTIWIEVLVTVVGSLVAGWIWGASAFWQAAIPGVVIGVVLLVGFLAYDITQTPYWLAVRRDQTWEGALGAAQSEVGQLTERIKTLEASLPDSTSLRERLAQTAVVIRGVMNLPVHSDADFEAWKVMHKVAQVAIGECGPLMPAYDWQRIANVRFDPSTKYKKAHNDEHRAMWIEMVAIVEAIDRHIDSMDARP